MKLVESEQETENTVTNPTTASKELSVKTTGR